MYEQSARNLQRLPICFLAPPFTLGESAPSLFFILLIVGIYWELLVSMVCTYSHRHKAGLHLEALISRKWWRWWTFQESFLYNVSIINYQSSTAPKRSGAAAMAALFALCYIRAVGKLDSRFAPFIYLLSPWRIVVAKTKSFPNRGASFQKQAPTQGRKALIALWASQTLKARVYHPGHRYWTQERYCPG